MISVNLVSVLENAKDLYQGTRGGGEASLSPNQDANITSQFLKDGISKVIRDNDKWLKVLFAIIILLIAFLGVIIWRLQSDKTLLIGLLSGQGLSMLFCINRLTYFYKQKRTSEILLYLFESAQSPEEKSKIIDKMIAFLTEEKTS